MRRKEAILCLAITLCAERTAQAYDLLHPVPRTELRELSPDRPDVTESPKTVDAGHFQFELSFLEYSRERDGCADADAYSVLPFNAKAGLWDNVDVQLVFEPYLNVETREAGHTARDEGIGNTEVRVKANVWGNEDDATTALAVMPFVRVPTGDGDLASDPMEGGLIVPFAVDLGQGFGVTTMLEVDFNHLSDEGWVTDFVHTVSLSKENLLGNLGAFVEYVGAAPTEGQYYSSAGTGVTYPIGEDVLLDAAVHFGLSEEAEDVTALAGVTVRL